LKRVPRGGKALARPRARPDVAFARCTGAPEPFAAPTSVAANTFTARRAHMARELRMGAMVAAGGSKECARRGAPLRL